MIGIHVPIDIDMQETLSSTALVSCPIHWSDLTRSLKELILSLGKVKAGATSSFAFAQSAKIIGWLTAFVVDGTAHPDDHKREVETLELHAASLPDDLSDRKLLLDLASFSRSIAATGWWL